MGTRPDEHKICFITCVTDAAVYNESLASLRRLIVPDGMTVESRAIEQAASMADRLASLKETVTSYGGTLLYVIVPTQMTAFF